MFEKLNLRFLKQKFDKEKDISKEQTTEFDLPLINAKDGNNGIMYYGRSCDFESAEMAIDIVNDGAVSTGNVYPQPQKTGVLYNAYLVKPLFPVTERLLYFFSASIQKSIKLKFGYENKAGWEKVKKEKISLPVKKDREIDFAFMEDFISQLEACRLSQLEAYLLVTGLKNYTLTPAEGQALTDFQNGKVKWREFKIVDLFDVKNTRNILSRDIIEDSGDIPYLSASRENNAVSSYISYNKEFLDKGNCIFIGGKTFVVTYQENDFYSNDSHNLSLHLKDGKNITKLNHLFMVSCIYKSLSSRYSWGNSISNKKIQTDFVILPVTNNIPDYPMMETLISAVQKLVIKDVVEYADRKIEATKQIINK